MKTFHFFFVKYTVLIKNENEFLKKKINFGTHGLMTKQVF